MTLWPQDYRQAWTLATAVERSGTGLHSGAAATVRLQGTAEPGYWLGFLDEPSRPPRRLEPAAVREARLCTVLQLGERPVATVEHLLAALAGTGVSQAEIWIEGEEVPLLDGSALPWVEAIAEAGLRPLGDRLLPGLDGPPLTRQQGESFIVALPAERPLLGVAVDYPQPAIGRQSFSLALSPAAFVREIAPARTFGFLEQVEQLRAAGLIRGGALENALVCDGERWLNPPLRFADEPARHKLLDLLGDLALAGLPQAQIFAFRGSHTLHTTLAAALVARHRRASSSTVPLSTR